MTGGRPWYLTYRGLRYGVGFRVAMLNLLLLALFAGLIGWYSQHVIWNVVRTEHAKPVKRIQNGLLAIYAANGKNALITYIKERVAPTRAQDSAMLLAQRDGKVIAGNLARWPTHLDGKDSLAFGFVKLNGVPKPVYMGFTTSYLRDGSRLLIGVPVLSEARIFALQRDVFVASLAMAVLLALLIWYLTATIMMRYFRGAFRVMQLGTRGEFNERVPLAGSGDRFDQFFGMINHSLDRVEPMMQEMRIVTTGVAHDVRSPLGRLRLTVERAMLETKEDHTAETLDAALHDVDQLLAMLSKTMEIAQAQSSTTGQRFEPCQLDQMLKDLGEMYAPVFEEKGIALVIDAPDEITISAHRHLLEKALSNIIENAINYAEGADRIEFSLHRENGDILIAIADNGIGIPEHRFEDAIRRYGRLDPARHVLGTGLGLTIADAVAKMHGGKFTLSSNGPGLCATLRLPIDGIS